MSQHS